MAKYRVTWYQTLDGIPKTDLIEVKDSKVSLKLEIPFDVIEKSIKK